MNDSAERTLNVAKTTLVTFSLTADLATFVNRAITSYFLLISTAQHKERDLLVKTLGCSLLER